MLLTCAVGGAVNATMHHAVCDVVNATICHGTLCAVQAKSDDQHKMAQAGKYAEDDEVLRVPLALAMVKLLQTLPVNSLDLCLPG